MSLKPKELMLAAVYLAAASLLTLLIYLPALDYGFVNWDDNEYLYANPHLGKMDSQFLSWAFTSFHSNNWHPLTWLSHAVDLRLWGLNARGHHLGNIALHTANTLLVGVFLLLLLQCASGPSFERPPKAQKPTKASRETTSQVAFRHLVLPSMAAALLFGVHPLHVESVVWVSERKDLLSTFFMLLSAIFYLRHVDRECTGSTLGHQALSLLCFALALMSKPMPLMLPVLLLLLDIYPLKRWTSPGPGSRRLAIVIEKFPYLGLSVASAILTLMAQYRGGATGTFEAYPLETRILVALKAIVFYLYKMVVPVGLSPLYPYPRQGEVSLSSIGYLASAACVLGISALCVVMWNRGKRPYLTAWLIFLVMLLPVLGLIHFGPQAAADRYTYATLIPLFALAGIGFDRLVDRIQGHRGLVAAAAMAAAGIACALCLLTLNQSRVWRDSLTVWNRVLSLYPDSELAYNRRADAYLSLGSEAPALADLNRSIELSEAVFEPSLYRRARILLRVERHDEALKDIEAAIAARPGRSDSYNVRGTLYAQKGDWERAIADFSRAIELDPASSEAYNNRGSAVRSRGDVERARMDFDRAIELDPNNAGAYNNRGMLRASLGPPDPALEDFNWAIALRADFAEAYLNRCELYRRLKRMESAYSDCTRGVELAGRSAPAHNLRGLVLADLGRTSEALSEFDQAAAIAPKDSEAYANKAVARFLSGDRAGAIEDFKKAARLGNQEIQKNLEKMGIPW